MAAVISEAAASPPPLSPATPEAAARAFCMRLLAGPSPREGAESLAGHRRRLGAGWNLGHHGHFGHHDAFVDTLRGSGLSGRGGGAFPTWQKWSTVAKHARHGGALIVANGSEGEPASEKDHCLMRYRPHLIIDGLLVAAQVLGARAGIIYLPREFEPEHAALLTALEERDDLNRRRRPQVRIVTGPHRYVAGETSAVVNYLNGGEARPRFGRKRTAEEGVDGLPTLVQNVETLAHVALIARFGAAWFRQAGSAEHPGTALVTVTTPGRRPVIHEIELGAPFAAVAKAAGVTRAELGPVLLGGYFGTWLTADDAWSAALHATALTSLGASFGCGVIAMLPREGCAPTETAAVLRFLARESARQCGPCWNGLDSISERFTAVVNGEGGGEDLDKLMNWANSVSDRGACHHPDGAIMLLRSCLRGFADEFIGHLHRRPCRGSQAILPTPAMAEGWM